MAYLLEQSRRSDVYPAALELALKILKEFGVFYFLVGGILVSEKLLMNL